MGGIVGLVGVTPVSSGCHLRETNPEGNWRWFCLGPTRFVMREAE